MYTCNMYIGMCIDKTLGTDVRTDTDTKTDADTVKGTGIFIHDHRNDHRSSMVLPRSSDIRSILYMIKPPSSSAPVRSLSFIVKQFVENPPSVGSKTPALYAALSVSAVAPSAWVHICVHIQLLKENFEHMCTLHQKKMNTCVQYTTVNCTHYTLHNFCLSHVFITCHLYSVHHIPSHYLAYVYCTSVYEHMYEISNTFEIFKHLKFSTHLKF